MRDAVIGFVGLGNMGSAMVRRLCNAGYRVHAWSRSASRYAQLSDLELTREPDLAGVCGASKRICINVTGTADVEGLLFGDDGIASHASPGTLVVDFSTIDAAAARAFAGRLAREHDIDFMDCPVSGGIAGARSGQLSIMAGGRGERFAELLPLLEHLGTTIRHVGEAGSGQAIKAANQMVMCIGLVGIAEAFNYAREQGADLGAALELLQGGMAGSRVLDWVGPHILEGFTGPATVEAHLHEKDIAMIARAAAEQGLHLPLLRETAAVLHELIARGDGHADTARAFEVVAAHLRDA